MTTLGSSRPPRLATWLIELFVSDEQSPSVLGDLVEEYSEAAAKSTIAHARRWYWRQALPTVLHLLRSEFQASPWLMVGVVTGGVVLGKLGHLFINWSFWNGFNSFNQYVFPFDTVNSRLATFLINSGILVYSLAVSLLIGCTVALLSKRREMPATLALSLACSIPVLTRFLPSFQRNYETFRHSGFLLQTWVLLYFFGGLFALVAGGAIVKSHRLRSRRAASSR